MTSFQSTNDSGFSVPPLAGTSRSDAFSGIGTLDGQMHSRADSFGQQQNNFLGNSPMFPERAPSSSFGAPMLSNNRLLPASHVSSPVVATAPLVHQAWRPQSTPVVHAMPAMMPPLQSLPPVAASNLFDQLDKNQDGVITREELQAALAAMTPPPTLPPQQVFVPPTIVQGTAPVVSLPVWSAAPVAAPVMSRPNVPLLPSVIGGEGQARVSAPMAMDDYRLRVDDLRSTPFRSRFIPPEADGSWISVNPEDGPARAQGGVRVEPAWMGGRWYIVAPADLKGIEKRQNDFGDERRQAILDGVDEDVYQMDMDGALPQLPEPHHWKNDEGCPIA